HPIVKTLKPQSYFPTYNDAYRALLKYNENPYDLSDNLTLAELYDKWYSEYCASKKKSYSTQKSISSVWKYCSAFYDFPAREIRSRHIRKFIDEASLKVNKQVKPATPYIKTRLKSLFNMMLDFAVEYEIIERNYSRTIQLNSEIYQQLEDEHRYHIPFTDREINALWNNLGKIPYINVILIQCYSGWRPSELGLIKLENVDLKNDTIMGGMKTEAGKNRIVPIHPKIRPLVEELYNEANALGSEYLINCTDGLYYRSGYFLTYGRYKIRFLKVIKELKLNPNHLPHDCRKHFITTAKRFNVDEYAIKYIVGHVISDITERVYTKRETAWLKKEIKKITK
nr:site-specific integrase [Lachnospiraceae bacterium]